VRRRVGKAIWVVLPVLCLVLSIAAAGPILSQTRGGTLRPGEGPLADADESAGNFRLEVSTDKQAYGNTEVLKLVLKLLNDSPIPLFVGPSVEAVSLAYQAAASPPDELYPGAAIGLATLTRLAIVPIGRRNDAGNAADARTTRLEWHSSVQWSLPLFGSPDVPGHSTRVLSATEIDLGRARLVEEDDSSTSKDPMMEPLLGPLEPGFYLLDCRVDGITGTAMVHAQHVVEIKL
jgi:hypothetical protein